ncbi:MAG: phospho-N-acetylmuramoyl-pentapeptide-transferase [bacterium]|nr:phospho-N-acetylmuramoyl-pentapeptide-transferase [bacterium]
MIYEWLYPLRGSVKLFNLLRYITFRAGLSLTFSLILTLLLIPIYLKLTKYRERISEYVPLTHKRKEGTPSAGGIVFVSVTIISTILFSKFNTPFPMVALIATFFMFIIGLFDDLKKLKGTKKGGLTKWEKLFLQFLLAAFIVIAINMFYPPEIAKRTQFLFFKNINLYLGNLYIIFIILVILGFTNAVNLTDGLDGLAAGSAIPPLTVILLLAYFQGNKILSTYLHLFYIPGIEELTILAASIIGSLIGFLWYNSYPAQIFMGDTGSQTIGGIIAVSSVLLKQEILIIIAGGLFVIEALSVLIQVIYFRATRGKRIFKKAPYHHHFEELGMHEAKITVRFWIISLIFSLIALGMVKIK